MARLTQTTETIVQGIINHFDGKTELVTNDIKEFCSAVGYSFPTINNRLKDYKVGRGKFCFSTPEVAEVAEQLEQTYTQSLVPEVDPLYVQFGNYKDIKSVIKSGIFFPLFITGLSGNGKTHSVEQVCASLGRDLVRVNVTIETDTDDLVGGFRLVNGDTVFHEGPVIEAMRRGAILLLDEIDLASNKILCLQSILEGKGYFVKKTNEMIYPAPGFNIVATANTKGRGSDTGKFIGANVLNEAFLERFSVTFEQEYPTPAIESKILTRNFLSLGVTDCVTMVENLTTWADIIRKTYADGGIEDVISTRRLINIVRSYVIFGSIGRAIELCVNRFDDDTKDVFLELYYKVSGDNNEDKAYEEDATGATASPDVPAM